jgi:hypothetical protein
LIGVLNLCLTKNTGIMGFFNNLINKITGGGAKVSLEVSGNKLQGPISVKITATVADAELKIDKVYVKVRATEHCKVRNIEVASGSGSMMQDVTGSEETFLQEFTVEGPQTLAANQTFTWSKEITLPSGVLPTFIGKNAQHEWEIIGALDASGNDPDSGWIKITLG